LEEMLQLLVNIIAKMMQARVCSIMLVDAQKNELVVKAAKASSDEYWRKPNLKIGKKSFASCFPSLRSYMISFFSIILP